MRTHTLAIADGGEGMKNKVIAAVILSIVAVIGGMVLNFQEFLMGSPANVKNLIVTFAYIAVWIVILIIGSKYKCQVILKYCIAFWHMTFIFSVLTIYVNAKGVSVDWAIPFVILLLGQWYGIEVFVNDFLTISVIVAIMSFAISTSAIILLKRIKSVL